MHILTQSKSLQTKQLFILVGLINSRWVKMPEKHMQSERSVLCLRKTTFLLNFNNMGENSGIL